MMPVKVPEQQGVVKISPELFPAIDKVVEETKDEYGVRRFKSRRELVDEAVRQFLKTLQLQQEVPSGVQ